jgi:hypothetical protein
MAMAVVNMQTTMLLTDLVAAAPRTSKPSTNPAAIYLSGLARTGRRATMGQLRWAAQIVGAEKGKV